MSLCSSSIWERGRSNWPWTWLTSSSCSFPIKTVSFMTFSWLTSWSRSSVILPVTWLSSWSRITTTRPNSSEILLRSSSQLGWQPPNFSCLFNPKSTKKLVPILTGSLTPKTIFSRKMWKTSPVTTWILRKNKISVSSLIQYTNTCKNLQSTLLKNDTFILSTALCSSTHTWLRSLYTVNRKISISRRWGDF